jgi:hypothetical protein
MADTLTSLRFEARNLRKLTHGDAETFILRAWKSALDSVRGTEPPELEGCGDNSCCIVAPKGMATNGGCRCDERALRRAVQALKIQRRYILASYLPEAVDLDLSESSDMTAHRRYLQEELRAKDERIASLVAALRAAHDAIAQGSVAAQAGAQLNESGTIAKERFVRIANLLFGFDAIPSEHRPVKP